MKLPRFFSAFSGLSLRCLAMICCGVAAFGSSGCKDDAPAASPLLLQEIGGKETFLDIKTMTQGTFDTDSMVDQDICLLIHTLLTALGDIAGNLQRVGLNTIDPEASIEHLGFPYTRKEYDFGDGRKGRFRCWLQNDPERKIAFLADTPFRLPRTNKFVYFVVPLDCRFGPVEPTEFAKILARSTKKDGIEAAPAEAPEDLIDSGVARAGADIARDLGKISEFIKAKNRQSADNYWKRDASFKFLFGEELGEFDPSHPKEYMYGIGPTVIFYWLPYDQERKIAFITSQPLRRRYTDAFFYLAAKTDGTVVKLDLHEAIAVKNRSSDQSVRFHPMGVGHAIPVGNR